MMSFLLCIFIQMLVIYMSYAYDIQLSCKSYKTYNASQMEVMCKSHGSQIHFICKTSYDSQLLVTCIQNHNQVT